MIAKRSTRRTRAFTLLEIVIAISILAVVVVITYSTLSHIIQAKKILDDRRDTTFIASAVLNRVTRELQLAFSSIALLPPRDEVSNNKRIDARLNLIGEENPLPNGEYGDSVQFVALEGGQYLPDGGAHSGLVQITYRLEQNPDSPDPQRHVLIREETPIISPPEQAYERTMTFPISKDVIGLKLRYFNREDNNWIDTWGSDGHLKLPAMVEMTLRIKSPIGEISTYTTAVALRTIY